MSIQTNLVDSTVELQCDECGKTNHFYRFSDAIAFKKSQKSKKGGWRTFKLEGYFLDACPACVRAFVDAL